VVDSILSATQLPTNNTVDAVKKEYGLRKGENCMGRMKRKMQAKL